jgi:hypothetical protein
MASPNTIFLHNTLSRMGAADVIFLCVPMILAAAHRGGDEGEILVRTVEGLIELSMEVLS